MQHRIITYLFTCPSRTYIFVCYIKHIMINWSQHGSIENYSTYFLHRDFILLRLIKFYTAKKKWRVWSTNKQQHNTYIQNAMQCNITNKINCICWYRHQPFGKIYSSSTVIKAAAAAVTATASQKIPIANLSSSS